MSACHIMLEENNSRPNHRCQISYLISQQTYPSTKEKYLLVYIKLFSRSRLHDDSAQSLSAAFTGLVLLMFVEYETDFSQFQ